MRMACVILALALAIDGRADEALSLAKKAALFEHDMQERFVIEGQALCKRKLPTAGRDFVSFNMPDNAYMTGIYAATLAMQYAATQDETARDRARESLDALVLLSTVSGKPGLLARAAWPKDKPLEDDGIWRPSPDGKWLWRGDVSSDQMAGVFYGFAVGYDLAADEAGKKRIARTVAVLMDHVLENDLRIIGFDGKPTTWGKYYPSYAKRWERLNALLFLQLLKVAHHVTGDAKYGAAYRHWALEEGYAEATVTARKAGNPTRPGMVNHSDDVLLWLGYAPLLDYETDETLRGYYLESLRRSWEGTGRFPGIQPEANPLYAFMAHRYLNDDSGCAAAIENLRVFPLDMKWNRDTIAAYERIFGFTFDPAPRSPEPGPEAPVPTDRRAKTWSAWANDPYVRGNRETDSPVVYNGHDYLWAYWLGRYWGEISGNL